MNYLRFTLIAAAVPLMALAAANWALDPFCIFGRDFGRGEQPIEHWPTSRYQRIHKLTRIGEVRPSALVLGTSRAGIGLPVTGWPWTQPAYNMAISGGNLREIRKLLEHALQAGRYRDVVVTLDFPIMFEAGADQLPDLFLRNGQWLSSLRAEFVGPLALLLSYKTLYAALCGNGGTPPDALARIGPDGVELPVDKVSHLRSAPSMLAYWQMQEAPYAELWREVRALSAGERQARVDRYLDDLRELVGVLQGAGRTHVLILPVHPWHLTVLRQAGLFEDYERWLNDSASIVAGGLSAEISDYSMTDCAWNEALASDFQQWFADPSHLAPVFGREVLADALGIRPSAACLSPPVRLDKASLPVHLRALRARLDDYANRFPEEARKASALAHSPDPRSWLPPVPVPSLSCQVWDKL